MSKLTVTLLVLAAFAAGFDTGRWSRRPITGIGFQHVGSCFSDGAIPCPDEAARPDQPEHKLHPYGQMWWERERCRWFSLCQQET